MGPLFGTTQTLELQGDPSGEPPRDICAAPSDGAPSKPLLGVAVAVGGTGVGVAVGGSGVGVAVAGSGVRVAVAGCWLVGAAVAAVGCWLVGVAVAGSWLVGACPTEPAFPVPLPPAALVVVGVGLVGAVG
jgi:hypothetical protein